MFEKLGRVYVAAGEAPWKQDSAYLPTPWRRDENTIRIFCSFMDANSRGRVGYVDVDAEDPRRVLGVSSRPLLELDAFGPLSRDGISPTCVFEFNKTLYLIVMCWQRCEDRPYRITTCISSSTDRGDSFHASPCLAILPTTIDEPDLRSAAFIEKFSDEYQMIYVCSTSWELVKSKQIPRTEIRISRSSKIDEWPSQGQSLIKPGTNVLGVARPWIISDSISRELWLGVRSVENKYHLRFLKVSSALNQAIELKDFNHLPNFDKECDEWESEMQAAPALIDVEERRYLFYNGNGFGRSGFGVAVKTKTKIEAGSKLFQR